MLLGGGLRVVSPSRALSASGPVAFQTPRFGIFPVEGFVIWGSEGGGQKLVLTFRLKAGRLVFVRVGFLACYLNVPEWVMRFLDEVHGRKARRAVFPYAEW